MKDERLTIRIDGETLSAAKKAAEQQNRTLSNYLMNLIKIDLNKNNGVSNVVSESAEKS